MKKELKKRLKADEFRIIVNKSIDYVRSNQKQILISAAGVIFVVLVILGIRYIQAQASKKESAILGQIVQLNEELKTEPEKLSELMALGGKGKFSRVAYVYASTHHLESGNLDLALSVLQNIPDSPNDLIYFQGKELEAKILALQEKYDEALSLLTRIESENPKDFPLEAVLFQKAEILAQTGDIEQALKIYKRIQEEFSQTGFSYDASQEVLKLEQKK